MFVRIQSSEPCEIVLEDKVTSDFKNSQCFKIFSLMSLVLVASWHLACVFYAYSEKIKFNLDSNLWHLVRHFMANSTMYKVTHISYTIVLI